MKCLHLPVYQWFWRTSYQFLLAIVPEYDRLVGCSTFTCSFTFFVWVYNLVFIPVLRDKEAEFSIRKIGWLWDVESVDSTCIVVLLSYNSTPVEMCDPFTSKYLHGLVQIGNWSFKIIDILGDISTSSIVNAYFGWSGFKFGNIVMNSFSLWIRGYHIYNLIRHYHI